MNKLPFTDFVYITGSAVKNFNGTKKLSFWIQKLNNRSIPSVSVRQSPKLK